MTEITVKVNTRELTRQLNDLDATKLSKMSPNDLKEFIKKNIDVVVIGSPIEKRFYVKLKYGDDGNGI